MWTVVSQKQKARHGLAVLILAGILVGCIIFAYQIQRYKQRAFGLDLDSRIRFSVPAGDFSMRISSDWQDISVDRLPPGILGGWRLSLPQANQAGFFYIQIVRGHPVELMDFAQIVRSYSGSVELRRLHVERHPEPIASLMNMDVIYPFVLEGRAAVLAMKVLYLPDDSSLILTMMGSDMTLLNWLDQTAGSLDFYSGEAQTGFEVPSANRRIFSSLYATTAEDRIGRRMKI